VAYPEDDSPSSLEFSYGLVGYTLPKPDPTPIDEETKTETETEIDKNEAEAVIEVRVNEDESFGYPLAIIAISLVAALGLTTCVKCRRTKEVHILAED
jgi:uncharacterized protein HemX